MKPVVPVIFICIMIIFPLYSGCSKEEKYQDHKKVTVIKQAIPQKPEKVAESQTNPEDPKKETTMKKEVAFKDENPKDVADISEKHTTVDEEKKGYYIVKKGENLKDISEKPDIMADPLKWPVLFRLNLDEFEKLKISENIPYTRLPEGIKLKFYTPEEQKNLLKSRENNYWVINVLSAKSDEKIVPITLKLIESGYPAYIYQVKIKGEDWIRLRVGFFNNKDEANKEGNKIMNLLKITDIWTTKVDDAELREFGKY